ncbi:MAG: CHAP domain-containing protein [Chitinophagales bacterium]
MKKRITLTSIILCAVFGLIYTGVEYFYFPNNYAIGEAIDSLNGVKVYFNGKVGNVHGRNVKEGYNVGLKYQCVEFVKRYYYEYLQHKMPDSYGHAVSFFDPDIVDGEHNAKRNLTQFTHPSTSKPMVNDLIVMDGTRFNQYGHVVIVSKVMDEYIEIIQQNPGAAAPSRQIYRLSQNAEGKWEIRHKRILGWLRKL